MSSYSWFLRCLDKVVELLDIYIKWLDKLLKYMLSSSTSWQPLDMSSRSTMLLSFSTYMSSDSTTSWNICRVARQGYRVTWHICRVARQPFDINVEPLDNGCREVVERLDTPIVRLDNGHQAIVEWLDTLVEWLDIGCWAEWQITFQCRVARHPSWVAWQPLDIYVKL